LAIPPPGRVLDVNKEGSIPDPGPVEDTINAHQVELINLLLLNRLAGLENQMMDAVYQGSQ
jgi:hypothetical protein